MSVWHADRMMSGHKQYMFAIRKPMPLLLILKFTSEVFAVAE